MHPHLAVAFVHYVVASTVVFTSLTEYCGIIRCCNRVHHKVYKTEKFMTAKSLGRRLVGSMLFILAAVYAIIFLAGIFLADSMMFVPGLSSYRDDRSIIKIPMANGSVVSAQLLDNPASRYTILFSHGNAEDIGDLSWFLKEFYRHGFRMHYKIT